MNKLIGAVVGFLLVAVALPVLAQTSISSYGYVYPQPAYNCPALSYNLYRGLSDYHTGGQVSQVQRFLSTRYYQPVTGYYGATTWSNVASFQREQGLWPVTGGVGPLTRAAIQRVCSGTPVPTPVPVPPPYPTPVPPYPYPTYNAPSINGVSGPTQLTVGQSGTWVLNVTDTSSSLSYSVVWGDEQVYPYAYAASSPQSISSSGSLSHTYAQAGTYTPRFTVTNGYGRSATASASVVVSGVAPQPSSGSLTAYPSSGYRPLAVTFGLTAEAGPYTLSFGDGAQQDISIPAIECFAYPCNPAPRQVSHTYVNAGTYTAQLIYQTPFYCPPGLYCAQMMPAPKVVATATVTVY